MPVYACKRTRLQVRGARPSFSPRAYPQPPGCAYTAREMRVSGAGDGVSVGKHGCRVLSYLACCNRRRLVTHTSITMKTKPHTGCLDVVVADGRQKRMPKKNQNNTLSSPATVATTVATTATATTTFHLSCRLDEDETNASSGVVGFQNSRWKSPQGPSLRGCHLRSPGGELGEGGGGHNPPKKYRCVCVTSH